MKLTFEWLNLRKQDRLTLLTGQLPSFWLKAQENYHQMTLIILPPPKVPLF